MEKLLAPDHAGHSLTKNEGVFTIGSWNQIAVKGIGILKTMGESILNPNKRSINSVFG